MSQKKRNMDKKPLKRNPKNEHYSWRDSFDNEESVEYEMNEGVGKIVGMGIKKLGKELGKKTVKAVPKVLDKTTKKLPTLKKTKSTATGVVTMAESDLYYTGGTIIMDHGHGISTIYSHLETLNVKVGDEVLQGDIIGTVGSTGRSTGPHLDFRVNWFQTRLDPMTVIN